MFKSIFTNSSGILVSRVLGFLRDVMTASALGASIYSDIFFVAFKLPNLFRRIFAEGAFTQSFLPAFTRTSKKALFTLKVFISFSTLLIIITLFVMLFAEQATSFLALGFSDETIKIATPYVRINFIYLLLIFWVTFFTALLQYKKHFATSAFSTALLNLSLIGALLLSKGETPSTIVYFLSYGVVFGGILQFIAHILAIRAKGYFPLLLGAFKYRKDPKRQKQSNSDVKNFKKKFLPAVWGNSTAQLSAFIDTWLASFLVAGSISYLYYANRIFQLPLALFAIATSVALFPSISRAIKNSDHEKAHALLTKAFWLLVTLLSLAMVGGIVLNQEIIWLLFEHGAFKESDRVVTANILAIYLIGLIPYGLSKLFLMVVYAKQEQVKAAKIATFALGLNILFSLTLIIPLKAVGLALASTLSSFFYLFLTLKAYGLKDFYTIVIDKKSLYLILLNIVFVLILYCIHTFTLPMLST